MYKESTSERPSSQPHNTCAKKGSTAMIFIGCMNNLPLQFLAKG